MGQSVMQEDWFSVLKFRVTVRAHLIRYDCFYHICWTADLSVTSPNWMVHHHKLESFVLKLDWCFQGQGHSEGLKLYWIFMYLLSSVPLISWQSRCTDLLLIITKPSTTKWAYTLTYIITRHTAGGKGYFAAQGDKPCFVCFHNPQNSDLEYGMFYVHVCSFYAVTHTVVSSEGFCGL